MQVGHKIRELRRLKGLTLKQVSDRTNLSVSYLSDIENNRRNPSLESLTLIAHALDSRPSSFLGESYFTLAETPVSPPVLCIPVLKNITVPDPFNHPDNIDRYIAMNATDESRPENLFFFSVWEDRLDGGRLQKNDLVLVRLQDEVAPGDLALMILEDGRAVLRRVYPAGKGLILENGNPEDRPQFIDRAKRIRLVGKVIRALIFYE